jgi:hypothetical protein
MKNIRQFIDKLYDHRPVYYSLSTKEPAGGISVKIYGTSDSQILPERKYEQRPFVNHMVKEYIERNGVLLNEPDVYISAQINHGIIFIRAVRRRDHIPSAISYAIQQQAWTMYDHVSKRWYELPKIETRYNMIIDSQIKEDMANFYKYIKFQRRLRSLWVWMKR